MITEIAVKAPDLFGAITTNVRAMATPHRRVAAGSQEPANSNVWRKAA